MSSSYRLELDRWLGNLEVKADKVLDIGGAQLPLPGRVKNWDVKEYIIADLPQPHADSPKPDVILNLNDGFAIHSLAQYSSPLIFCLEVFDYVWNPFNALMIIHAALYPKGTAWVTFPTLYPLHQPVKDDALRYMPGGIEKLANSVGLKIEDMIPRRTETDAIYNAFRVERMRCAKHEDHNVSGWIVKFTK